MGLFRVTGDPIGVF